MSWNGIKLGSIDALLAKHTSVYLNNKIFIVGGGALCFSFGSFFNSLEVLLLDGQEMKVTQTMVSFCVLIHKFQI